MPVCHIARIPIFVRSGRNARFWSSPPLLQASHPVRGNHFQPPGMYWYPLSNVCGPALGKSHRRSVHDPVPAIRGNRLLRNAEPGSCLTAAKPRVQLGSQAGKILACYKRSAALIIDRCNSSFSAFSRSAVIGPYFDHTTVRPRSGVRASNQH